MRRRRRLLLRRRRGQHVVDIVDQVAHPRGIGAEIVAAVARSRAHIDAGAIGGHPHRTTTSSRKPRIGVSPPPSIIAALCPGARASTARGKAACGGRASTTRQRRLVMTFMAALYVSCGVAVVSSGAMSG